MRSRNNIKDKINEENLMKTLHVNLPGREYKIDIGLNILDQLLPAAVLSNSTDHVVVVTNTTLHDMYPDRISQVLQNSGVRVSTCVLEDGEEYKNLETLSLIFDFLMKLEWGLFQTIH